MRATSSSIGVVGGARVAGPSLAARLASRHESALAELYDGYAGRAFGLAYRVLDDAQAAEDVVQDAFLWIWENGDRVDESRGSPGALLLTVTHRRAIDALRRRSRGEARSVELNFDLVDEAAMAMLAAAEEAEVAKSVKVGLAELSPFQRQAIELTYFDGMTQSAIAERQNVPLGTVKSRLRLALGHLKSVLGGLRDADV